MTWPATSRIVRTAILLLCLYGAFAAGGECRAQELEPRAYAPNPVGINFLILASSRSTGGVVFDPSLPVSDVEARLATAAVAYGHTFSLLSHSASAMVVMPYAWGSLSGNVGNARRKLGRSGPGDIKLRFSMNLLGGKALTPREFARRVPGTILGTSLTVIPPTGQYQPTRLINIGSNRWAIKPELGVSTPVGPWYFEAYCGIWLFTSNGDFDGGKRRSQDPIVALQAHVSYTFRPRLWLAFDFTYYRGGRLSVNGVTTGVLQDNTRVGLTLSVPVVRGQSLKLSWNDGLRTLLGEDFSTIGVAWQISWIG